MTGLPAPTVVADDQLDRVERVPMGMRRVDMPRDMHCWGWGGDVFAGAYRRLVPCWVLESVLADHAAGQADSPWAPPERELVDIHGRPVAVDELRRPLNPAGRTGVGSSLGALRRWGPSLAADAVVVRNRHLGRAEVLLGRRQDNGMLCFPGGMALPGEPLEDAARRELREETGFVLDGEPDAVLWADRIGDYREGDHAWIETKAMLWEVGYPHWVVQRLAPQPGETTWVGWMEVVDVPDAGMSPGHDMILRLLRAALLPT